MYYVGPTGLRTDDVFVVRFVDTELPFWLDYIFVSILHMVKRFGTSLMLSIVGNMIIVIRNIINKKVKFKLSLEIASDFNCKSSAEFTGFLNFIDLFIQLSSL